MALQVVLVTGASRGIGKAAALAFVKRGFITYATARRVESLSELRTAGCESLALDVTDEASMQAAVETIEKRHKGVDVLVNNAGYMEFGPLEEVSLASLRREFETNVFGLLRMSQLVIPVMRQQKRGRIINIGSVGGTFTAPGAGAYHMSKYAVESLSDALRFEVKPFGIAVVLIQPTGVQTDFSETGIDTLPETDESSPYAAFKRMMAERTREIFAPPARGILKPEAVAKVILRAATTRRPRTRYPIGLLAHVMPTLRQLTPDRLFDSMMAQQFSTRE